MLTSSFVLLKGIGQSSERRLWQECILDWASFLQSPTLPGISSTRKAWYDRELATAQSRLEEAPVLTAFQTGPEEVRVAFFETRLGCGEFTVIPRFSGGGDAGQGRRLEE